MLLPSYLKFQGAILNNIQSTMKTLTARFYAKEELTKEERDKINVGSIRLNRAQCLLCNEIITSDNRHDYKSCKCKNLSVDGGSWYSKRSCKDINNYTELSEIYKDV
jgi:hypothetical protein